MVEHGPIKQYEMELHGVQLIEIQLDEVHLLVIHHLHEHIIMIQE